MPNQLDLPPVYAVIAILAAIVFGWFGILISGYLGHGFWGVVLILIGIGLVGWSAWLFKEYQTTIIPRQQPDALVMDGPFLISRNPMYLGMVLITLGVGVFMGPVIAYIPAFALAVFLDRNFIEPEERKLRESFGNEADAYIEDTARWIGYGPVKV